VHCGESLWTRTEDLDGYGMQMNGVLGWRGWEKPHPLKMKRVRHPRAVLLVGLLLGVLAGSADAQTAGYRVAGIVVSDGDGLALGRTRVSLADVRDRRKAETVVTGADGRFEFRNVPAGKFSLEGARRNFMITTYQWHEGYSTAIVTGAGLDTENLVLRLIPLGSIAGKVIDETGEPVRGANVKLAVHRERLGEDRIFPQGFAQTDDEGKYEFGNLMPAEYFVSVAAKPWYAARPVWENLNGVRTRTDTVAPELNVVYARTYYNGATEQEGATPLSVTKGERLTADLHLNPMPALTVIVKTQVDPGQNSWSPPLLRKIDSDRMEEVVADMSPSGVPGEMMVTGLAPGRYAMSSPNPEGGMLRPTGQVDITEDGQTVELKAPQATSTVKVRVKTLHGEELRNDVSLSLRDEHRRTVAYAEITGKTEAVMEPVPAGKYAVMVNFSGPPPYTIGKMVIGGTEVEGHDITVGENATVEIDATLMAGVVSVEGVVKRKEGKPVSGAMVALVPRGMEARTHFERIRWDQSDLDGTFTVRQILPGKYTLIAVEDAWGTAWLKDGVLEKYLTHGQELTIGELMTAPVVLPEALEAQKK
jgi:hypothetical protein